MGDVSRFFLLVYNGFHNLYFTRRFSSNRSLTAWWACSIASIFYLLTALVLVQAFVISKIFGGSTLPDKIVVVLLLGIFGVLAGWGGGHKWFGISAKSLPKEQINAGKIMAVAYLIGGWLIFFFTSYLLYSQSLQN